MTAGGDGDGGVGVGGASVFYRNLILFSSARNCADALAKGVT